MGQQRQCIPRREAQPHSQAVWCTSCAQPSFPVWAHTPCEQQGGLWERGAVNKSRKNYRDRQIIPHCLSLGPTEKDLPQEPCLPAHDSPPGADEKLWECKQTGCITTQSVGRGSMFSVSFLWILSWTWVFGESLPQEEQHLESRLLDWCLVVTSPQECKHLCIQRVTSPPSKVDPGWEPLPPLHTHLNIRSDL